MLTVWILGGNLVRHFRGIADAHRVDGTNPDDILLLWFDTIVNPELQLFDGSIVDPEPLELWTSLRHLNVVAGDGAAAVLGWRLPGDIDVLPAGVGDGHLQRRRWSTWKEKEATRNAPELITGQEKEH